MMIQLINDLRKVQNKSLWISELDKFLRVQNAFPIIKLHGFLTAISSSPQMILPSQWLSLSNIQEIDFESTKQATDIMGKTMSLYNDINSSLRDATYKPLLYIPINADDDVEKIWQQMIDNSKLWADGYLYGAEATWPFKDNMQPDPQLLPAFEIIQYLTLSRQDFIKESKNFTKEYEELNIPTDNQMNDNDYYQIFIDCLPIVAIDLYNFWLNKKNSMNNSVQVTNNFKIGRNDLCHCGSGKKYKKCCLH